MDWQDLESDAWELLAAGTSDVAAFLARQAIEIEPNAIDCYNILSNATDVSGEKIAFSREAVRLGEIILADEIKSAPNGEITFWGNFRTRPYMRGLQGLALALSEDQRDGAKEEAIKIAKHSLRICPSDNLGFRFLLEEWTS